MKSIWTDKEISIIKESFERYNGFNYACELIPYKSPSTIRRFANKKLGLRCFTSTYNENFFDVLTPKVCAVAGSISSDGCITKNERTQLSFHFAEKDLDYWDKIKSLLEFTGKYYRYERKAYFNKSLNRIIPDGVDYSFCVSGVDRWADKLYEHFNITSRKSYTLTKPNITDLDLSMAYIQGILDGDGSVVLMENKRRLSKKFTISVVGTKGLLEWIKSCFDLLVPFSVNSKVYKKETDESYEYSVSHVKAYALAKYFLSLDVPRMDRKWNAAREHIEIYENKPIIPASFKKLQSITNPKLKQLIGAVNWQIKRKTKEENKGEKCFY